KLNHGQTATLSRKVLGNLTKPKVQYTDAVGKFERLEPQSDTTFSTELKCADRAGRIVVQVGAEREGADVSVANFQVGCGVELPIAAAVSAPGPKQGVAATDPAAAEKQLVEMINRDRTAAGLKPLDSDADLSKVARSPSDDRAKGQGTSPSEAQKRPPELDTTAPTRPVSEPTALKPADA